MSSKNDIKIPTQTQTTLQARLTGPGPLSCLCSPRVTTGDWKSPMEYMLRMQRIYIHYGLTPAYVLFLPLLPGECQS